MLTVTTEANLKQAMLNKLIQHMQNNVTDRYNLTTRVSKKAYTDFTETCRKLGLGHANSVIEAFMMWMNEAYASEPAHVQLPLFAQKPDAAQPKTAETKQKCAYCAWKAQFEAQIRERDTTRTVYVCEEHKSKLLRKGELVCYKPIA